MAPGARPLSRICSSADWTDADFLARMQAVVPSQLGAHRKAWEFAAALEVLETTEVLNEEAIGLSVAAGHEALVFYLANRCRWMFAVDIYGEGPFGSREGSAAMLVDPDVFAPYPYRRRRLTVAHMDALDLRFEDATFDFVVSLGSIEHFGGREAAREALVEMARVLRPGGTACVCTEVTVDGGSDGHAPGLELFSPASARGLGESVEGLDWAGEVDFSEPPEGVPVLALEREVLGRAIGTLGYPHIRLGIDVPDQGWREFTSACLALRRV